MTHSSNTFTLLDGSQIEGYPLTAPVKTVNFSGLSIDTTGEYLQVGSKRNCEPDSDYAENRSRIHRQFYEHVNLFIENKDRILSDSRMFLCPIEVENAMAFTGRSGFQNATLGVYLEWWLHHAEASIDSNGNPIWFISGSPLSGAHACSSVDRENKSQEAKLKGRFRDVWESFMEVNKRYTEEKSKYQSYSIEEVINLMRNT